MAAEEDQGNVFDFNISMHSADSESYLEDDLVCIKCRDPDSRNEEIQEVERGMQTLINYALKCGNDALVQYLQNKHASGGKIRLHQQCQKDIYNYLKRKNTGGECSKKMKLPRLLTRSNIDKFKWKENCFFCGKVCVEDKKHPDRKKFQKAATLPFRTKVLEMCLQRMDDWAR